MSQNHQHSPQKPPKTHSKPKLSQKQVHSIFPPIHVSPLRQLPPDTHGQVALNQFQKALTIRSLEPWQTKVPPEEYGDQTPEKQQDPKPYQENQIDETQKRITDYLGENSKKFKKTKERNEPQLKKQVEEKPQNLALSPKIEKLQPDEYKVIVKASPAEKEKGLEQSFYKNNDIYGVEDQLIQSNQMDNPENKKANEPEQGHHEEVTIDKPVRNYEYFHDLYKRSNEKKRNQESVEAQIVKKTPYFKHAVNQNRDQSNIRHEEKDLSIDGDKKLERSPIEIIENGVDFHYNQEGDIIYLGKTFEQRLSLENSQALIIPVQQKKDQGERQQENSNQQVNQEEQTADVQRIPEVLKSPQIKKIVIYREEVELEVFLDYLGVQQAPIERNEPHGEQNKEAQLPKGPSHESKQAQVQKDIDINIDIDKPLNKDYLVPIRIVEPKPTNIIVEASVEQQSRNSKQSAAQVGQKKTTKRKQFTKGNTKGNTGSKFNTPHKSQNQNENQTKKSHLTGAAGGGSLYHFQMIQDRASKRKSIVQVRRSSRIYEKSKTKFQREEKLRSIQQNENQGFTNTRSVIPRRNSTQPQRSAQKSKSKEKPSKVSTTAKKSKSKKNTETSEEEISIEWLKEHVGELNEIVIQHVYMEEEYYAMTEKDEAISRFLRELEEGKEKVEVQEPQVKNQGEDQNQQENRKSRILTKPRRQTVGSKKKSKPSKSKPKNQSDQNQSKSKGNIKIERTVELEVKNSKKTKVVIPQEEIDYSGPWKGPFLEQQAYLNEDETAPNMPEVQNQPEKNKQRQNQRSNRPMTSDQKKKRFLENKEKYQISEELPITVQEVIDPDILGLGVYALVKLGKLSEFQFGAKYAITPLCAIKFAKIRSIFQALEESKKLVPPECSDNIALIALNTMLIELIDKAKKEKERQKDIDSQKDIEI